MPIRNQNWYDLQGTRRYPLDDACTGDGDDASGPIRDSVLVDCHIRFPEELGATAFVQAVTVTASLVTVVIGVAADIDSGSGVTIAAVSLPLATLVQNKNYAVKPFAAGVAGWVVFGPGVSEPFTGRYSTPRQSALAPRCARAYRTLPIQSIKKLQHATELSGVVTITAADPITCTLQTIVVDDVERQALVFALTGEVNGTDALEYFLGPCGQRPESGTCRMAPIETINGVAPDCDGNINIVSEFDQLRFVTFDDCAGGELIASLGLEEACGEDSIRLPGDKCNPSAEEDEAWYNPVEDIPPEVSISEYVPDPEYADPCLSLPLCVDFSSPPATEFQVIYGAFAYESLPATGGCGNFFSQHTEPSDTLENLISYFVYGAANTSNLNLALLKNCASDWAIGRTIQTEMKLRAGGLRLNGGIVLNYLPPSILLDQIEQYVVVRIAEGRLQICSVTPAGLSIEAATASPIAADDWCTMTVSTTDGGTTVNVYVTITSLIDPSLTASLSVALPNSVYGDRSGSVGLYSYAATACFTKFEIT